MRFSDFGLSEQYLHSWNSGVDVKINNINDAPVFTLPSNTYEDTSFQLTATDIDADVVHEALSFEALPKPDWIF